MNFLVQTLYYSLIDKKFIGNESRDEYYLILVFPPLGAKDLLYYVTAENEFRKEIFKYAYTRENDTTIGFFFVFYTNPL